MDRLRPRNRPVFFGFTNAESHTFQLRVMTGEQQYQTFVSVHYRWNCKKSFYRHNQNYSSIRVESDDNHLKLLIEKMEKVLKELGEQSLGREFCQKLATSFNRSSGRAGKPVVKWTEIWFQTRLRDSPKVPKNELILPEGLESKEGEIIRDPSELEFEARSSKDGAWYDVEKFLAHRFLSSGEAEVRVRFVGFGAEEDEWVNIKNAVRERSVPLENTECSNLKVGDPVLCFQERRDQAIYYDAHILEIQRRMHDIRGCRCLFLIRYDHDNSEEKVRLRRLCCRPRSSAHNSI